MFNLNGIKNVLENKSDFTAEVKIAIPVLKEELECRAYKYPVDYFNCKIEVINKNKIMLHIEDEYKYSSIELLKILNQVDEKVDIVIKNVPNRVIKEYYVSNIQIADIGYSDKIVAIGIDF